MLLHPTKPNRKTILHHTITGMTAVDIAENRYRSTTDPHTKETWITAALQHPDHINRANAEPTAYTFTTSRLGTWNHHRTTSTAPLTITLGTAPTTDLDLALTTAQISRILGMPHQTRAASGKVHDRATIMLMTSALTIHDPDRGQQFHRFCAAMKLTMDTPATPWPWTTTP